MKAIVYPSTVQKNEYGGIYGKVINISAYPAHPASMLSILQDEELVKKFNRLGPSFSVAIILKQDASTYSGFAWSSSLGPHQSITPGTLVTARVTVEERHPISLLFPALRSLIEGS
jgi:HlyD family secretion protein